MKNKGFTLIELLAVIVILAIIALIATPIILGIINEARDEARERSADMVYTGVEYAYTTSLYQTTEGAVVGTPTLTTIKNNLKIENVESAKLYAGETEITSSNASTTTPDKLTIVTEDDVTCEVTGTDATGFTVKCGDGTTADKYLNEVINAPETETTTGTETGTTQE